MPRVNDANPAVAPLTRRRDTERTHHADTVVDPYSWLADRESPEVLAHLEAENAYTEAVTAHTAELQERLFAEIKARVKETDLTVPVAYRGWWYYSRTVEGSQYSLECRVPVVEGEPRPTPADGEPPAGEQVLIDGNALAEGHEFFALGSTETTHDGTRLAYTVDVDGDERYDLVIADIPADPSLTGDIARVVDRSVTDVGYGLAFSLDGRYVFYARNDDSWRQFQVWRHEIDADPATDVLVHEETDERFSTGVGASRDDRWVVVAAGSKTTSEMWLLDAADPTGELRCVRPRVEGVEYEIDVDGDRLVITHNEDDVDFSVSTAPLADPGAWVPALPATPGERVLGVETFEQFWAVSLRRDGLAIVRVLPKDGDGLGAPTDLTLDEPLYTVSTGSNPDPAATRLQVVMESMVTPKAVYEIDVRTGERELLKATEVPGYDPAAYEQRREWALAPDGTRVPMSLVYRRGLGPDGTNPGVLYGYGSYEHSYDPYFSVVRTSMLDRGVVFAIAHVRGGGEMGRRWYDEGKLAHKRNTFTDFVACAEHLVETGWVAPDRLAAEGGSAGGLLMGAVANLAPERFAVIHAAVPFVDALNTILDPTLPLTVGEWEEWGNPLDDPDVYAYMKSYSPYENVRPVRYPAILATTSLNDTRVYCTEPAKWVARLREVTTNGDDRPILLKTEMAAGHGGSSGRYTAWRQYAFEVAFVLDRLGATERVDG